MSNREHLLSWCVVGLLVGAAGTAGAARNAAAGIQRTAEEQYLQKVNVACDTQLTLRYDAESLKQHNKDIDDNQASGMRECNEPLRYLYYSCQSAEGRAAVKAAQLRQLACRGTAGPGGTLSLADGVITVERAYPDPAPHARNARAFEKALGLRLKLPNADPYYDQRWLEMSQQPNPVAAGSSTFCQVNHERLEFSDEVHGQFMHRRDDATLKCVRDGQVMTELALKGGRKTGFVTERSRDGARRVAYVDDKRHGEERRWSADGTLVHVSAWDQGQQQWAKDMHPGGTLASYWRRHPQTRAELRLTPDGRVTRLTCGPDLRDDPEMSRWCGFGAESTVPLIDHSGKVQKIVSYKDGVIQKEAAGDSTLARQTTVAYLDGRKHGEERVLGTQGRLQEVLQWERGTLLSSRRFADDGVKVVLETTWKANEVQQRTERFLNGNPKLVETFEGGAGRRQLYWDTGQLRSDSPLARCGSMGQQWCENGVVKTFYENGTPRAEAGYRLGKVHGTHRRWWENGKPERVEEFAEGRILKSQRWDKDGNLTADEEFEADGSRKLKR